MHYTHCKAETKTVSREAKAIQLCPRGWGLASRTTTTSWEV